MNEKKPAPAFVIDPAPTIKWPVTVSLPADGGEVVEYQFTGVFNRLSETAMDAILSAGVGAQFIAPEAETPKRMQDILRENAALFPKLLAGWEGVASSAGNEVEYSAKSLQEQITGPNGPFLSAGLWRAISEIRNGARLGN